VKLSQGQTLREEAVQGAGMDGLEPPPDFDRTPSDFELQTLHFKLLLMARYPADVADKTSEHG
jgi:hypothetical protein